MVIGMNTRREAARRAEEEMANVADHENQVPPQDNQLPPVKEVAMDDQVPVVPLLMTNRDIRVDFLSLAQDMTSQANVITSQVQSMKAQVKRDLGHRVPQHASTMASL